ncbi:uncharacterized protein EI90DRAFT_3034891 [Cantharellus anzutake]|uniref:uncharacterized protein n=1 Tax=Cantharellus anzutake TaxID=1750568 RepID=UPI001907241A|nr:uncharacterized protein EI90DRAFT_3034891 [Cantharellus anzutake]KAF8340260.1 hypothetical protein EI90DRAFT_3034891 [Cantharellus anzutake]
MALLNFTRFLFFLIFVKSAKSPLFWHHAPMFVALCPGCSSYLAGAEVTFMFPHILPNMALVFGQTLQILMLRQGVVNARLINEVTSMTCQSSMLQLEILLVPPT